MNILARRWLSDIGFLDRNRFKFIRIYEHLEKHNDARIHENKNKNLGTDVLYLFNSQMLLFNVKERALLDDWGTPFGSFLSFLDITRYKKMITKLEKGAGIDPLTGLSNRVVYENNKALLDSKSNYPLSIIIGDVNGLKKVNDNMGHQYGDVLLQLVAMHIKKNCPSKATICRVGGDEFFILLPKTETDAAKSIMTNIQRSLQAEKRYPFQPSISFGVATKRVDSENLDQLLYDADIAMYKEKGDRRRKD